MKISCVIPLRNEEDNFPELMYRLVPVLESNIKTHDYELILVNDNSTDETAALIDEYALRNPRIRAIHRKETPGFGNALSEGFSNTSGDIIIPVMGDLSDDPEDIAKLVKKIEEGYDVVYGSRFVKGGHANDYPHMKLIANRAFNNLVRLLYGMKEKDVTNAFKAYRREVLEEIGDLEAEGFDLTVEIPLKAHIHGFKSIEVPVSWHGRKMGVAKLKLTRNGLVYGKRLLNLFLWGNIVALKDLFQAVVKGSKIRIILAVLLGILMLGGIFSLAGLTEVYQSLKNAQFQYFFISCLAVFMAFPLRTWRWSILLRTSGRVVPRSLIFNSLLFGWFINYLLPARVGDVARGITLKTTADVPLGLSLMTIVVERIFDMFMLVLFLIPGVLYISPERFTLLAVGAIGIIFMLVFGLLVIYHFDFIITNNLKKRVAYIQGSIALLKEGLRAICKSPIAIILCFILSIFIWTFEILSIYFASRAVQVHIAFLSAAIAGVTAFILQTIPLTPAGIGIHEGSIAGILAIFEIPLDIGTSIALIDHFARALVIYTFGAVVTIHIGFQSREYFKKRRG